MEQTLKILVITPVLHINGIAEILNNIGEVTYLDDPSPQEVAKIIDGYDALFTNPNKSKVFIGRELLTKATRLKVVCTASTGTNHIDKTFLKSTNIELISLTKEIETIRRISSTAELALALTMGCLRNVHTAYSSVLGGDWDYTQFIGRQINCLTVGVIGFGRLGEIYAKFCYDLGAEVIIYDPYKTIIPEHYEQADSIEYLAEMSDVISLHIHVNEETTNLINKRLLSHMKDDVIIINTSRGEVVNENDLVVFLKMNPKAKVGTDVLSDEIRNRSQSPLLVSAHQNSNILITPHIGGMTREAQEIAYGRAAKLLEDMMINS